MRPIDRQHLPKHDRQDNGIENQPSSETSPQSTNKKLVVLVELKIC